MSKNWNITKKKISFLNNYDVSGKQAFDLIVDLFINLLENDSKESYRQVKNALNIYDAFKTEAEKHFMQLLPKLLVSNRNEDIVKLCGLIRRSACMYDWGTQLKSYKTYIRSFIDFLEKFNSSKSKNKDFFITELRKLFTPGSLTAMDELYLSESYSTRQVFLHDRLRTKFYSRLRGQSRTSGDKVWLPLNFIAKIYKKKNDDGLTKWLYKLVDEIYIHYTPDNGKTIKSVSFNSDVFLDFECNKKGEYDVFIIWTKTLESKRYRVYTPTGEGNKKVPMTVKDISDIDIDHVKSIDQTLRELDKKKKIPLLGKISDIYRGLDDPESLDAKDLNDAFYENIDIASVTKELNLIRKDGVLRLMDSQYNEQKSNGTTFEPIIKTKSGDYLGIMASALLEQGDEETDIIIYQKLSENGVTRASTKESMPKGRRVRISKQIIDLL